MAIECAPGFDRLRPASFRGVGFQVDSDSGDYGRRIVMHEYPMRDTPFAEDMGRKSEQWKIKGYVDGADAEARKNALVAASRLRGPATLQLPQEPARLVVCKSLSVTRSKDAFGIFQVDFVFEEAGIAPSLVPIPIYSSLIQLGVSAAVDTFTAFYSASFRGYDVLPYVQDRAVERIRLFANDVIGAVEGTPVSDDELAAEIVRDATDMYKFAPNYVRPTLNDPTEAEIVAVVGELFFNMGRVFVTADAVSTMKDLAQFMPFETVNLTLPTQTRPLVTASSEPLSVSDLADARNAGAFNGVVRSFGLMAYAQAVSNYTFTNRPSAIQARADLVELFERQLTVLSDDAAVVALVTARDYAVKSVTKQMADLAPVVTVEAPMSLPSLYWSHRLYGVADRATELAERNNVSTPAFMPVEFEALAR